MAIRGVALTVPYVAWNTATSAGQAGDAANHVMLLVRDGVAQTPSAPPVEVPGWSVGLYTQALTAAEMDCDCIGVAGRSATAGVVIIPVIVVTEHGLLAQVAAAVAAGVPANVTQWAGGPVPTPGVPGMPMVDVRYADGVAGSATAQAGGASTITLAPTEPAVDHVLDFQIVEIVAGTGAGQVRWIADYVGATRVATVSRPWATIPDTTSVYALGGTAEVATAVPLAPPRALDAVTDASVAINDALWCAVIGAAGKEAVDTTAKTYTVATPSDGTVIRTFTLDSGTAPTQRT